MKRILIAAALLVLATGASQAAEAAALTACTTGQTTCSNDTTNASLIVAAINDGTVQARVANLWDQQCEAFIYSEATTTAGHTDRVNFCLSLAAGKVPATLLVSTILNPTTTSQILAGSQPGPTAGGGQLAGNLVDADVSAAAMQAMTVNVSTENTTATASSGSEALTVASATGIFIGQNAVCAGCAAGAQVAAVNGTTVYLTAPVTAALSTTPVAFTSTSGLATRAW